MAKDKIFIQEGDQVIELKGKELEAFLQERVKDQEDDKRIEEELKAQKELKTSAYKKLGLTDEEINAII